MKLFPSYVLVVAACILFDLAALYRCEDEQQSFGGTPIKKKEFLWLAAIVKGFEETDVICSGALISPRHVLTADHCLREQYSFFDLWVRVGYFCRRPDNCGESFELRKIMEYRRDTSLGDVAILVLSAKVPSTFPPATPDVGSSSVLSHVKKGDDMLLVGVGKDGSSDQVAAIAQNLKIQLQQHTYKKCGEAIADEKSREQLVSKATICSSSDQGSPCKGDSGAPVLVKDSVGTVIVAIHSYGQRVCSKTDNNALFGHVAVNKVATFLVSVVCLGNNNNDDKKETWCPPISATPSSTPNTCTCSCPPPNTPAGTCNEESCAPFIAAVCDSTLSRPSTPDATTPAPSLAPIPVLKAQPLRTQLLHDFTHKKVVYAVAFDATSSRLASSGGDKRVKVWDPSNGGSPLLDFKLDACCPNSLAFDPTGRLLAVADGGKVVVLNVSDTNDANKPRQVLMGHTQEVEAVAWHPDGKMLASGADDSTVRLWNVATGNVHHSFGGHSKWVKSVSFEPQGRYLASGSEDKTIRIWDVSSLAHFRTLKGHTDWVWSVAYSPDGTKLASGSWDNTVRVWRASDGSPLAVFSVGFNVRSVAWSSDGQFLASGSSDARVRIWDATQTETGEALLELSGHSNWVWSVAWSPNGEWIASGSSDRTVKVWKMSIDGRDV